MAVRAKRLRGVSIALLCALAAPPAGIAHSQDAGTGTGTGTGTGSTSESEPESESESESGSESESESEPESEPESESESESDLDPNALKEKAAISAWAAQQRIAVLSRELRRAEHEERDAVPWIPWAMAGTGVAAVTTGLLAGALPVATCDDSCARPNWTAVMLVAGAAVATAGGIWLVLVHRDEAELRLRRERIEQQLENERWNLRPHPRAALSWSGRL